MAEVKKSKDGCDLQPGDCVCGDVTCPDSGHTIHIQGVVVCVEDDGNVKVAYPHMHVECFDPCDLCKDA